jgi:hypothetical protein
MQWEATTHLGVVIDGSVRAARELRSRRSSSAAPIKAATGRSRRWMIKFRK